MSRSAFSLRLFGEDVTIAAREASKKKRLAASATSAVNQVNEPEPGSGHDDKDGDAEEDENDDMDAEEQAQ